MKEKTFFNLSIKVIIVVSSVIILTSFILSSFFISKQSKTLMNLTEQRVTVLAESFANSSQYAVVDFDSNNNTEFLYHLAKNVLNEDGIIYSVVYDFNGRTLAEQTEVNDYIKKYVRTTPIDKNLIKILGNNKSQKDILLISNVGKVMDIVVPITSVEYKYSHETEIKKEQKTVVVGAVRLGVDISKIDYQKKIMINKMIKITLLILLLGLIFSFVFSKIIISSYFSSGTKK